jgi:parallel beta-helix repeat protein
MTPFGPSGPLSSRATPGAIVRIAAFVASRPASAAARILAASVVATVAFASAAMPLHDSGAASVTERGVLATSGTAHHPGSDRSSRSVRVCTEAFTRHAFPTAHSPRANDRPSAIPTLSGHPLRLSYRPAVTVGRYPDPLPSIRDLQHNRVTSVFNSESRTGLRIAAVLVSGALAACGGGGSGEESLTDAEDLARGGKKRTTEPAPAPVTDDGSSTTTPTGVASAAGMLAANALGNLTASGPIVLDGRQGAKVTGLRISNPNGPCVVVRNGADIEISGNEIGPCAGNAITLQDSARVRVERNNIRDARNNGVVAVGSSSIQVRSNYIDRASTAIRAVRSTGVTVDLNGAMNIRGPFPDGQLAQFDSVYGGGNKIRCNATDLSVGQPNPSTTFSTPTIRTEDIINTWMSHGLSNDPIEISYNRLKGGGSFTGSGIMTGDGGGSWITAIGNRIVNPWNAGIGVAGGNNIRIERNRIFSDMPTHIAGEGLYIRNFYQPACYNITHNQNEIKWPGPIWTTQHWTHVFWDTNQCSNVTGTSTNNLNANVTPEIFNEPIAECRNLASNMGYAPTGF